MAVTVYLVAVMVSGHHGFWPSWFVAVMVCGRHVWWPSWFVAVMVCGRHGLWPSCLVAHGIDNADINTGKVIGTDALISGKHTLRLAYLRVRSPPIHISVSRI